jgi:hypothetical protein
MQPHFSAVTNSALSSQDRDFTVFLSILMTRGRFIGNHAESLTIPYLSYAIHD